MSDSTFVLVFHLSVGEHFIVFYCLFLFYFFPLSLLLCMRRRGCEDDRFFTGFLLLCLLPLLFLLLVGAWDVKLIDVDVSIKATMVFWVKLAMIRVNV
jgi:hypothetical protein